MNTNMNTNIVNEPRTIFPFFNFLLRVLFFSQSILSWFLHLFEMILTLLYYQFRKVTYLDQLFTKILIGKILIKFGMGGLGWL